MIQKVRERAAELVEQGWCTGNYAQDAQGKMCKISAPERTKLCLIGAVVVADMEIQPEGPSVVGSVLEQVGEELGLCIKDPIMGYVSIDISNWNDASTAEQVAAALRGKGRA